MFKDILVTGGAGFIGSRLVLKLQEKYPKAHVTVIDNFYSGHFKNLQGFKGQIVNGSVADPMVVGTIQAIPCDAIFHLASWTDTTNNEHSNQCFQNIEGFKSMCAESVRRNIPLIFASSAAVYGKTNKKCIETDDVRPENVYAFTKAMCENVAELLIRAFVSQNPVFPMYGFRFFNVYGPGEIHKGKSASMITQLATQMLQGKPPTIFKDGEQRRDFIHVDDVVRLLIDAAENPLTQPGIYNCGTGQSHSFNEVIRELRKHIKTPKTVYAENPYGFFQEFTEADLTLTFKRFPGWIPSVDFKTGIENTVNHLKKLLTNSQ